MAAVLLGAAESGHRLVTDRAWWSRWDIPLLVAAGVVAMTALAAASGYSAAPVITMLVGVETLAVAWRLRTAPGAALGLGTLGAALVLAGAAQAGGLWSAAALLVLAAALTAMAARTTGATRILLQVGRGRCLRPSRGSRPWMHGAGAHSRHAMSPRSPRGPSRSRALRSPGPGGWIGRGCWRGRPWQR